MAHTMVCPSLSLLICQATRVDFPEALPWPSIRVLGICCMNSEGWVVLKWRVLYYLIPDAVRGRYCTIRYSWNIMPVRNYFLFLADLPCTDVFSSGSSYYVYPYSCFSTWCSHLLWWNGIDSHSCSHMYL